MENGDWFATEENVLREGSFGKKPSEGEMT